MVTKVGMNRVVEGLSLYILLIILFLGLSKMFSHSQQATKFIKNEKVISYYFPGSPLTLILLDAFQAGFIIKTYYLKVRVVRGAGQATVVSFRTSEDFFYKNKMNIGMSIFRRHEDEKTEGTNVLPPGSLYIGDPIYGRWIYKESGDRVWQFYKAYRGLPETFLWGDFRPTYDFYDKLQIHGTNKQPFYGIHQEFGTEGSITKSQRMAQIEDWTDKTNTSINKYIGELIKLPPWQKKYTQ